VDNILEKMLEDGHRETVESNTSYHAELVKAPWFPVDVIKDDKKFPELKHILFRTPDVKMFCSECGRVEPFNSVFTEEFYRRGGPNDRVGQKGKDTVQVFVFSFLCQSCKSLPEVFIVRREGFKLILSGRAPIEHVEVPPAISKQVQRHYSGAIVAYQSGQTLAGIFLLRTLIEQWAQYAAPVKGLQADAAIDSYMTTLPDDFKGRFDSLRVLYGELSADIHSASGSADLFEKALSQITKHFEARRLFDMA
jgi:hypothetical protein